MGLCVGFDLFVVHFFAIERMDVWPVADNDIQCFANFHCTVVLSALLDEFSFVFSLFSWMLSV